MTSYMPSMLDEPSHIHKHNLEIHALLFSEYLLYPQSTVVVQNNLSSALSHELSLVFNNCQIK